VKTRSDIAVPVLEDDIENLFVVIHKVRLDASLHSLIEFVIYWRKRMRKGWRK
jgi:hypothetical protein